MPVAIASQGLTRRFDKVTAVDDLTFTVDRGEIFGVVGPDGAGKTTLIRMLAGLMRPSGGRASVLGQDVAAAGNRLAASLGYMSQRFGLYPDLTVGENFRFFADLQGVPPRDLKERMERLLGFSGLTEFAARPAGQLSGGMKQKLGLACALVHQPPVLLLDEPTNGVDPVSRRDFWQILYQIVKDDGVTIFVSTAYLDEAERCGRLALLHKGRFLALDTPQGVRRLAPGTLYAWTPPDPRAAAALLQPQFPPGAVAVFGTRLQLFAHEPADLARAEAALAAAGIVVGAAQRREPSLEDVFVAALSASEATP